MSRSWASLMLSTRSTGLNMTEQQTKLKRLEWKEKSDEAHDQLQNVLRTLTTTHGSLAGSYGAETAMGYFNEHAKQKWYGEFLTWISNTIFGMHQAMDPAKLLPEENVEDFKQRERNHPDPEITPEHLAEDLAKQEEWRRVQKVLEEKLNLFRKQATDEIKKTFPDLEKEIDKFNEAADRL